MVARDDSVIRGSLITCLIFLVLSIALNFFLWRWGNTNSIEAADAAKRRSDMQNQARQMEDQLIRLKKMLGLGTFTPAELETMKTATDEDADIAALEQQFVTHMGLFGQDVEQQGRNYKTLPEYMVNAIRERNQSYAVQVQEVKRVQGQATQDVENAKNLQAEAEKSRNEMRQKMETQTSQYEKDREKMIEQNEAAKDELNKTVRRSETYRRQAEGKIKQLETDKRQQLATIDTQKITLNRLRATSFENTQGEVISVFRGGNLASINLGSADKLIPGITFGVIDGEETRLKDADVKATVQVTQVQGEHLSTVRVIARPRVGNPVIPGDKVYSPFWAPGRVVKIALAGDIDIDDDGRPDNEALKGQIKAAGAEVAAEVSMTGDVKGKLDATIRFLVIGDDPEVSPDATASDEAAADAVRAIGRIKAQAAELGLTVIPAWKLESYLKTVDDTLTTPLGSAVRADDFRREVNLRTNRQGQRSQVAEIYKRDEEDVQKGNNILPP